jgi:hypothetical protein
VSPTGFEGSTIAGKKNDKMVGDDLLKDEIVSEQLTRYCMLLPIILMLSLQKLFLNIYFFVLLN